MHFLCILLQAIIISVGLDGRFLWTHWKQGLCLASQSDIWTVCKAIIWKTRLVTIEHIYYRQEKSGIACPSVHVFASQEFNLTQAGLLPLKGQNHSSYFSEVFTHKYTHTNGMIIHTWMISFNILPKWHLRWFFHYQYTSILRK